MIINCSRAKVALTCWRKAFNNFHRGCEGERSFNLIDGGAFHEAVAHGLALPADHNWEGALGAARTKFELAIEECGFIEMEKWKVEQHWEVIEKMVEIYKANYQSEEYTILQPECAFDVALPNTDHNCIFVHHLERIGDRLVEKWGPPSPEAIIEQRVRDPHYDDFDIEKRQCACWQPHRLVGKTDALIKWKGTVWLMEHKTSAIKGEQFWDQWHIDIQPTTYMYGLWKATNLRPRGFILDMIYKPSEKQIAAWNARRTVSATKNVTDYMDYDRQAFLRTDEDLLRVERQYIDLMNEWESRIAGPLTGQWPMANAGHACRLYNRRCDYWTACLTHDDPKEFEALGRRKPDYVNEKLVKLLPPPSGE